MDELSDREDPHVEFVSLLNGGHRRLLAYLVSILGNRHDAEDVLQRASVTMWRKFATFQRGTEFLAWASTVAFYEARNFQRTAARSRLQFSEELLGKLAEERLPDLAHTEDRHAALEHCLGQLDEPGRALLEAVYAREGSVLALAEKLGRAPQTLYNKLNILRRLLAECITQKLAGEAAA